MDETRSPRFSYQHLIRYAQMANVISAISYNVLSNILKSYDDTISVPTCCSKKEKEQFLRE
jgi:hypothetical protein